MPGHPVLRAIFLLAYSFSLCGTVMQGIASVIAEDALTGIGSVFTFWMLIYFVPRNWSR